MGKRRKVKVRRINWDTEYLSDIISGNGFTITEPATFSYEENKEKSLFGSRSILYGSTYEDENAFIERYRCDCGSIKGRVFEGEICPFCKTEVTYKDSNIKFTGWLSLGNNYIINPLYYNIISDCIGKEILQDIVTSVNEVDVDGNISLEPVIPESVKIKEKESKKNKKNKKRDTEDNDEEEKKKVTPKNPFFGIGLIEFRNRFTEIMEYFEGKKKKKSDKIRNVIKERINVFTSHIPIYSTMLRPQSSTDDTFYFNSIDRIINPLFNLCEKIKSSEEIDKQNILIRIQKRVNKLWQQNFDLINGKDGIIRGTILGGDLNFTSRNVIILNPNLKDDQIDMSYHTFLELFKLKIIYYISRIDDISLMKAYQIWSRASKFDPRVYEIINLILETEHPMVLINRNPTLNYYSILRMNIHSVKPDVDDYTLSVPLSILAGLNADNSPDEKSAGYGNMSKGNRVNA